MGALCFVAEAERVLFILVVQVTGDSHFFEKKVKVTERDSMSYDPLPGAGLSRKLYDPEDESQ